MATAATTVKVTPPSEDFAPVTSTSNLMSLPEVASSSLGGAQQASLKNRCNSGLCATRTSHFPLVPHHRSHVEEGVLRELESLQCRVQFTSTPFRQLILPMLARYLLRERWGPAAELYAARLNSCEPPSTSTNLSELVHKSEVRRRIHAECRSSPQKDVLSPHRSSPSPHAARGELTSRQERTPAAASTESPVCAMSAMESTRCTENPKQQSRKRSASPTPCTPIQAPHAPRTPESPQPKRFPRSAVCAGCSATDLGQDNVVRCGVSHCCQGAAARNPRGAYMYDSQQEKITKSSLNSPKPRTAPVNGLNMTPHTPIYYNEGRFQRRVVDNQSVNPSTPEDSCDGLNPRRRIFDSLSTIHVENPNAKTMGACEQELSGFDNGPQAIHQRCPPEPIEFIVPGVPFVESPDALSDVDSLEAHAEEHKRVWFMHAWVQRGLRWQREEWEAQSQAMRQVSFSNRSSSPSAQHLHPSTGPMLCAAHRSS
ncbi:hypothetical protein TRVL_01254 [Trypanosoma vivax]|nr:hypothetical protein TRVL_01254 [Trypanosoma vivax]